MSRNHQPKLTRREFAGTLAAGLAAPALLGALPDIEQQKKEPPPQAKPEAPAAAPEKSDEEKMLEQLRAFAVPEGAEPAFIFRARLR